MSCINVFFYVQHLWGVGHVYRATRIARALANKGFEVHLVWGGTRIPGFDFSGLNVHYLPAVRTSDASFSQLLHEGGRVFTKADEEMRRDHLLALFEKIQPGILMTEAYPFGRRQMRFELLPLMERATSRANRPMTVASIRDIMQEGRKNKRVEESCTLVEKFYDLVLVHGDKQLIRIEESLQGVSGFADKIRYTGLVTPEPAGGTGDTAYKPDVLVSVGGGAFGRELIHTALEAMQFSKQHPSGWLVIAGSELPDEEFEILRLRCPEGMSVVRHVPDLVQVMKSAKISVSHAGYNTVGDLLVSGIRAVLYPYTGGSETEQLKRATVMAERGLCTMIRPGTLTPRSLANGVDTASVGHLHVPALDIGGAEGTAKILKAEFDNFTRENC